MLFSSETISRNRIGFLQFESNRISRLYILVVVFVFTMIIVIIEGKKIVTMLLSKDLQEEEKANQIDFQETQELFEFPLMFIFFLIVTRRKRSIFNHEDFLIKCSILLRRKKKTDSLFG